jgi:sugar/nucleoside kinase (ribokinase family)
LIQQVQAIYTRGFLYGFANGLSLKTCGEFGALLAESD